MWSLYSECAIRTQGQDTVHRHCSGEQGGCVQTMTENQDEGDAVTR